MLACLRVEPRWVGPAEPLHKPRSHAWFLGWLMWQGKAPTIDQTGTRYLTPSRTSRSWRYDPLQGGRSHGGWPCYRSMEVIGIAIGPLRFLRPWIARVALAASLACAPFLLVTGHARASFGIAAASATVTNRDGTLDLQAGSHPFEYSFSMTMNNAPGGGPEGALRAVAVDLAPGLVGNPPAVPPCSRPTS